MGAGRAQAIQLTRIEQQGNAALSRPLLQGRCQRARTNIDLQGARLLGGTRRRQRGDAQREAEQGAEQPPLQRARYCHHRRPPQYVRRSSSAPSGRVWPATDQPSSSADSSSCASPARKVPLTARLAISGSAITSGVRP
eukprot:138221_1